MIVEEEESSMLCGWRKVSMGSSSVKSSSPTATARYFACFHYSVTFSASSFSLRSAFCVLLLLLCLGVLGREDEDEDEEQRREGGEGTCNFSKEK